MNSKMCHIFPTLIQSLNTSKHIHTDTPNTEILFYWKQLNITHRKSTNKGYKFLKLFI